MVNYQAHTGIMTLLHILTLSLSQCLLGIRQHVIVDFLIKKDVNV